MSIRQSRMIALINAAIDYQQALRKVMRAINTEVNAVRHKDRTVEEMAENLSMYGNEAILLEDITSSQNVISQEHHHFKKYQKRNEWMRDYQERNRTKPRQRNIYEPPYATEQLSPLAHLTPAFPVNKQDREPIFLGNTIDEEKRRKLDEEINKKIEQWSPENDEEVDPNFTKTDVVEHKE